MVMAVAMLAAINVLAQVMKVTGTVVDENNEPVVGASVKVKGTQKGCTTDVNGNFVLERVDNGTRIEVSCIGMVSQTLTARPKMQIRLSADDEVMSDVMVVAFGSQTRSSFTGSAAVVGEKQLEEKQLTNVLAGLQGEATGVQMINNSGDPQSTPSIRIRGFSSINAGNSPLIIVDGAPYDGGWNNLNPNDVASISVLKDAASNALYGARGANGVIMITTKKAKSGEAQVTLDAKWGSTSRIKRDYETINDPGQYYETYYKALYNYQTQEMGLSHLDAHNKANAILNSNEKSEGGLGYVCYTVPQGEYLIGENGRLNPHATLGNRIYHNGQVHTIYPDDWKEEAFRHGFRQEYNLNVNGGNARSQFYASLGYLSNEGVVQNSDYERYTARLKADYQAKKWMKLGANASFSHSNYNYVSSSYDSDIFATVSHVAPIFPVYLRDGNGNIMTDSNGRMYDYGDGAVHGLVRPVIPQSNPLQENRLNSNFYGENAFTANGYMDFNLYDGLKLTLNGTATTRNTKGTLTQQPFYGFGAITCPDGQINKEMSETYAYNFQQLLNYSKDFGKHHVEAMAGHEYYRTTYNYLFGARTGMASYFENQNLCGAIKVIDNGDAASSYNNEGYFLRGQYDFGQRYFGSVSFRRDASSRFHPDHRWGNFFSVGAAWIMNKEKWLQDVSWIDMLKLKASFGQQGNDNIGDFLYMDTYSIENNGDLALSLATKGNPNITWETNHNFNAGIEFEFLKSRLRGGIEFFTRKTTDMLCFVYAPYTAGYAGSYYNIGDMLNKGVELELAGDVIKTRNVTWSLNLNATHFKNEVVYIAEDLKKNNCVEGHWGYTNSTNFVGEGLPLYAWYLKKYAGVSENGKSTWWDHDANGNLVKTEQYGDADEFLCGDPHPDLFGGFGTNLSAFGFDLSVTFAYSLGGKAYDYGYASLMGNPTGDSSGFAIHKDVLNAWTPQNTGSDIPRWQYGDTYSAGMSDRFLTSASYLSLQNVNLGYNLPRKWVKALGLQNVRFYAAGDNLFYLSKRRGFDPRGSFSGSVDSNYSYSTTRTISGGVKVTF